MNENLQNNDWIKEAPVLAAMERRNPFSVPDGYFKNGEEVIFNLLFLDQLKEKSTANGFDVPQNYFDSLTERIETRISLAEMAVSETSFRVPENYFDTLQSRINSRIAAAEPKKEAKIVSLWKRNLVKYASAACFLLISSFGVYFYQNHEPRAVPVQSADFENEQMLYDIDESIIIEHLEAQQPGTVNVNTSSASDTEMENYILNNYSSNDLTQEL